MQADGRPGPGAAARCRVRGGWAPHGEPGAGPERRSGCPVASEGMCRLLRTRLTSKGRAGVQPFVKDEGPRVVRRWPVMALDHGTEKAPRRRREAPGRLEEEQSQPVRLGRNE